MNNMGDDEAAIGAPPSALEQGVATGGKAWPLRPLLAALEQGVAPGDIDTLASQSQATQSLGQPEQQPAHE